MALITTANIARPDDFFAALTDLHRELTPAQSEAVNAKLPAEQAEQWGLIWRAVDDDQLQAEALAMAAHLAAQPTRGLANIKRLLNASFSTPLHEQLEQEKLTMRELGRSADYREGVAAFMAKRKPQFTGE